MKRIQNIKLNSGILLMTETMENVMKEMRKESRLIQKL